MPTRDIVHRHAGFSVSATIRAFTSSGHFRFRLPTGRNSVPDTMEKLRPDQHQAPISRLRPRRKGGVQATLTKTLAVQIP